VARYFNTRHLPLIAAMAVAMMMAPTARAYAGNEAMLKLLRILRDRGSITAEEYEDLRMAAEQPEPGAPTPPAGVTTVPQMASAVPVQATRAAPALPSSTEGLNARVQALEAQVAKQDTDVVKKALANKWYERIGLRGYTQFRFAEAGASESGPDVEVPADRSVNDKESFVIRRGRFVFSGDATERLALYAQMDFNGSTGAADFSLQMRDLYADIALDKSKAFRVRLGQSKVPFGWVNMQSSQNRAALERPEGLNSAVEGERDYGAYLMWASPEARRRFRDLVGQGLKGSGDYGVLSVGLYNGQGLNRPDLNGDPHVVVRGSYPFKLASGQFFELGAQAYRGTFVTATQAITANGAIITPTSDADGLSPARRPDGRVVPAAAWHRGRMELRAWAGAERRSSIDRRAVPARRLRAGELSPREQLRGVVPVRSVELLRRRSQVRAQRAAHESQRSGFRAGARQVDRAGAGDDLHADVRADADERVPYTEAKGINRLGAGAVNTDDARDVGLAEGGQTTGDPAANRSWAVIAA
jgi:hypothetical protein